MAGSFLTPIITTPASGWILRNTRTGRAVATTIETAFDSSTRNKGLLGRRNLAPGHALILAPCTSIHTFFMQFPIDVLFVARDGRVTKIARALPAWRIAIAWRAYAVVELRAGALRMSETQLGDTLSITRD